MGKIILKLLGLLLGIMLLVLLLGQLDFKGASGMEDKLDYPEENLGELMLRVFEQMDRKIENEEKLAPPNDILEKICLANGLECDHVRLFLFGGSTVNAFALPGNHIVLYRGLIRQCETAEELAGVIAHELAHIKLDHIRRKVQREIGLNIIGSIIGGSAGGEIARQTALLLANTSYGRQMELEADEKAVAYLMNTGIDPNGLATLLSRISAQYENLPPGFYWFSTHPETNLRVRHIREKAWTGEMDYHPLFSDEEWMEYLALMEN
ncbi:MAG: hypothetical protein EA409_02825 [Saprospirales bacterium]|nr:MAG: hypothetical protein EA409_02825 [Saprospirales bacterium]